MEQFVELNRLFYQLPENYGHSAKSDDIDISETLKFRTGDLFSWGDLLNEYRAILLAEAGAGKTQEIHHATIGLRSKGKQAFFMRLEHLADDLESCFEVGKYQDFQNWLNSNEEGWLLLDSVDEARLKHPKDFENAIRKLSTRISIAKARTHIVITSRVSAWRPKSDLQFCSEQFPFQSAFEKEDVSDNGGADISLTEGNPNETKKHSSAATKPRNSGFKIYSLTDLSRDQIDRFLIASGIEDSLKFLNEIEKQDAFSFTTRPQDLEEFIDFWNTNKRIGTRFELMQHSIKRRLKERDQNRADAFSIPPVKALEGVRLLASACVFMHESTIRVPDGTNNSKGIDVTSILTSWDDKECQILLNRPIFDEAIYGSVRFHHRSVREYLTADWLSEQLKNEGSRQKIESLFFRTQYEMEVIVLSMKPVLSWLVLLDSKIMQRVYKLEPEIILQGGDPGKLPFEKRKELLNSICERIAASISGKFLEDHAAAQRFALPDLADDMIHLAEKYNNNEDVIYYLLQLIGRGRIKKALSLAKRFTLNPKIGKYTRIEAITAVKEIGSKEDLNEIFKSFITEEVHLDRRLLAELINNVEATDESAIWVLKSLEKIKEKKKRYDSDVLMNSLLDFVDRSSQTIAYKLIEGIDQFLRHEPLIERRYCKISQQYGWLMNVSIKAIEKLIVQKHPAVFNSTCLFALTHAPAFKDYSDFENGSINDTIPRLISEWREFNHALFWFDVEEARRSLERKEKRLTDFWDVYVRRGFWRFSENDFELIVAEIKDRVLLDDQLVALSLAFRLYKNNNRPKGWLVKLKKAVSNEDDLEKALTLLLHPPSQAEENKKWKQREAQWKRRNEEQEKKRQKDQDGDIKWLNQHYPELRINGLKKGQISQPQHYVFNRMQLLKGSGATRWADGNWRGLIKDYGIDVATAFRDGMVAYWRTYIPAIRSEKNDKDTPLSIVFGLSGLEVESTENKDWLQELSLEEAKLASRYAFHELNDFPDWFPRVYQKFPDAVTELIINEISWELETESPDAVYYYILSKVSGTCEWLWDSIAPKLLEKLEAEPLNTENLSYILKIVQSSSTVSDQELSELATKKCNTLNISENIAYWFAVWIGLEPQPAIKCFSLRLETFYSQDKEEAKNLAMRVIVNLMGGHRSGPNVREAFRSPEHLKDLYVLMHQYIKVEEDIDRSGTGVFSPGLRDDAQSARNSIFSMLKEIPGKKAYLAMMEMSKTHPVERHRIRMQQNAKERAEMDADISPWSAEKFVEFAKTLEGTPTNHRELFELGVQRLMDLKLDLEESDGSIASILIKEDKETGIRKYIANWCNDRAKERYFMTQEEELADAKRPDFRFLCTSFDAPVPVELKIADNWPGLTFFERLENQLCGDYLRDVQSNRGIFVLVWRGEKRKTWDIPNGKLNATFPELIEALQNYWVNLSSSYPKIEQITVIGIDLKKRMNRVKK